MKRSLPSTYFNNLSVLSTSPIEELVSLPKDTRISSEKEIAIHEVRVLLKDMNLEQIKLILEIVKAANEYFKKQGASQG